MIATCLGGRIFSWFIGSVFVPTLQNQHEIVPLTFGFGEEKKTTKDFSSKRGENHLPLFSRAVLREVKIGISKSKVIGETLVNASNIVDFSDQKENAGILKTRRYDRR